MLDCVFPFFLLRQRQWNGWSNLAAGQIHDFGQRAYSSSMINDLIQTVTAGTMQGPTREGEEEGEEREWTDEVEQTLKSLCASIGAWRRSRGAQFAASFFLRHPERRSGRLILKQCSAPVAHSSCFDPGV
jgi:hypothetical protein